MLTRHIVHTRLMGATATMPQRIVMKRSQGNLHGDVHRRTVRNLPAPGIEAHLYAVRREFNITTGDTYWVILETIPIPGKPGEYIHIVERTRNA